MKGWIDPASLRAAWWAERSLRAMRRQFRDRPPFEVSLAEPPPLPQRAFRGVRAVVHRRDLACLERSLLYQSWLAAQGERVDVVFGVTSPREFSAHAWLDGYEADSAERYVEVARRPAP